MTTGASEREPEPTTSRRRRKVWLYGICALGVCVLAREVYNRVYRYYRGYPCGPNGIPFLGCIPYMKKEKSFYIYLSHAFGSVAMFYLGFSKKIVFINNSRLFCHVVNHKNCLYRPSKASAEPINVVNANGAQWKYQRKLMQRNFSAIINNSNLMEAQMKQTIFSTLLPAIDAHIQNVKENENEKKMDSLNPNPNPIPNPNPNPNSSLSLNLNDHFYYILFNIIFVSIFNNDGKNGETATPPLSFESPEYQRFYAMSKLETNSGQSIPIVAQLFFGYNSKYLLKLFSQRLSQQVNQRQQIMFEYTFPTIQKWYEDYFDIRLDLENDRILHNKHENENENGNENENICCYGQLMLSEFLKKDKKISLPLNTLLAETRVLFRAGTDVTAETAYYGLLLLGLPAHVRVQELVYNEIKAEMDRCNMDMASMTRFSLRAIILNLHLFRALVHEILRISSIARSGVPRQCVHRTHIQFEEWDFVIPKHAVIMANIPQCHIYDETVWGTDGKRIHLQNWLDDNARFKYNPHFIGFSVGKRDCPGKVFATKSLYYIFAVLIVRYVFRCSVDKIEQNYEKIRKIVESDKVNIQIEKRTRE